MLIKAVSALAIIIVVVVLLVVWLGSQNGMEEGNTVTVEQGGEFSITLASNPTTGYGWESSYDELYVQLIGEEFIPGSEELVGAGGEETFTFGALQSGTTEITFSYIRPWEGEQPDTEKKVYTVVIE